LIADSDTLSQLEELNLNYNQLQDSGAIELTHSNKLKHLNSINSNHL